MKSACLFIIGNGFDQAHRMPTGYGDFKKWLVKNNRFDVILELQSAYPIQKEDDYLLWCDFEKALGEYDIDTVINWSWENLFLTEDSLGNQLFNGNFIDTQLPDIIDEAFTKWVRSISIPTNPRTEYGFLTKNSIYLTFNYTDTLEQLYHIPERQVLHIHGRTSNGEKLIYGHNRTINPVDYLDDSIEMRENNERLQRLTEMNILCKPVDKIIERYDWFFKGLGFIEDIHILGHSCNEIDYPYFKKIKESVSTDVKWHFNPHASDDMIRIEKIIQTLGITNYIYD